MLITWLTKDNPTQEPSLHSLRCHIFRTPSKLCGSQIPQCLPHKKNQETRSFQCLCPLLIHFHELHIGFPLLASLNKYKCPLHPDTPSLPPDWCRSHVKFYERTSVFLVKQPSRFRNCLRFWCMNNEPEVRTQLVIASFQWDNLDMQWKFHQVYGSCQFFFLNGQTLQVRSLPWWCLCVHSHTPLGSASESWH